MRSILLIRHGEVAGDAAHRYIGRTDLPMSPAGEARVRAIAAELAGRVTLDAILCSDLGRSKRTAELLSAGTHAPVMVSPRLREIDMGAWEGLSRREVEETRPEEYQARGRDIVHFRPPGGETFAEAAERALALWRVITEADADGVAIAIAGHAGINRLLLCHVLGMPLENAFRIAQHPGCVNLIQWDRPGASVRLVDATAVPVLH